MVHYGHNNPKEIVLGLYGSLLRKSGIKTLFFKFNLPYSKVYIDFFRGYPFHAPKPLEIKD
jgi:hypothetical protein